ncbi:sugar transferase [Natronorubrum sulfidifaciens]|uniref:Exopolysaccharide biosynthesis polyprenyl glycosylphosphotransferase n=1 Tax=Natronorubrum sulfidifaciens JCM 14089 TaxID=1230460 RepID=L9WBL7_9EURY|nr:sugar transferase [Natronorubrum sulfidifaciens]ELY45703.1 exopolysaccharide biosynthesis polyprenyl glycosylphosphotransferase [Natronorubrum sulfidifaciens JCM 14089]
MVTGWRYRIGSSLGAIVLTACAVLAANHPATQSVFTAHVPLFDRLEPTVLSGASLWWAVLLSVLAVAGALLPLYKPQPRRILDTVFLAQKRVLAGGLALATLGYFKWSHRLPRATLVMTFGFLFVAIPAWFVWIRRPAGGSERTLLVGDDLAQLEQVAPAVEGPVVGYLCPTSALVRSSGRVATDGGVAVEASGSQPRDLETILEDIETHGRLGALDRLGGLSRLEDVLLEYDIDTVVLAFGRADRAEFFGALDACHDHGVSATVHREYADSVLVADGAVGELVDVDLEPWDPLDHLFKRVFDVVFASVGLVVFAPLLVVIAAAIKLDSPGPVFYSQDRTAGFGETFPVYKFRSMLPESEDATPGEVDDRITRVGRVLRKTHLDELPQLWSIFVGDMSVVGPRAAWTEEEVLLEEDAPAWRKRWFVKPGLTGLAQINDAKSTDPNLKLRYDLEYIRKQSLWFDLQIVIRQVWTVLVDILETVRG